MKISKLFHWLYALLMLLPIFAIGVTCGYAIFNKNAYQSWSDNEETITYKKITTSEFALNKYYSYIYTGEPISGSITFKCDAFTLYKTNSEPINVTDYSNITINDTRITVMTNGLSTIFGNYNSGYYRIDFKYISTSSNTFVSDNPFYEKETIFSPKGIDNVFYLSVDKVRDMPIFSWANDSFVKTPIEFLTGMFGMANDNPILTIMSYWLSISIIWLMFDIVMYIPLLVHRLIDKGMVD